MRNISKIANEILSPFFAPTNDDLYERNKEEIEEALKNKNYYDALKFGYDSDKLTEEQKLETVKENGYTIKYIKNSSENVQLEAVKQNGWTIEFINNPSERVQLEAVKRNGNAICYIENPSERVQLETMKQHIFAIKYIQNPSERVQLEAVKRNKLVIRHIKNPCQAVKDYLKIAKVANEILSHTK